LAGGLFLSKDPVFMLRDVFFDESGDLGWQLTDSFRVGGSSNYFTIAFLILPPSKNKLIDRFVRRFNDKRGSSKEFKGANFRRGRAAKISREMISLFRRNADIEIVCATIDKRTVAGVVQEKGNNDILYNYLVREGLIDRLRVFKTVRIVPDQRSIPHGSQNSCADLLKTALWFDESVETRISYAPEESHANYRLQFIDWMANFTWRSYENGDGDALEILRPFITEIRIGFS
jgi:hypothetical protein